MGLENLRVSVLGDTALLSYESPWVVRTWTLEAGRLLSIGDFTALRSADCHGDCHCTPGVIGLLGSIGKVPTLSQGLYGRELARLLLEPASSDRAPFQDARFEDATGDVHASFSKLSMLEFWTNSRVKLLLSGPFSGHPRVEML